ncbi:hypothetical protein ACTNAO_06555 [Clostridium sp. HCP1S3_C6]|uniref:hypothetical protein n=1 Tax=Clostridium sp. HCP1S3_C6 TaxID=3438919 RepID=UPI003F894CB9
MGRKEQRIKNKLEKNPIKECLSIQKKFYPRLFNRFNEVADPRDSSYIDYSNRVMLGTELDEGLQKKNDNYLERCYNRGTAEEYTRYHRSVLEAKIYFGNSLIASIATEPIENDAEYSTKKLSDEEIKQDCESKAFLRLSQKLKKAYPRLPICILADGLYVSEKVINRCKEYNWDYIIRYKEGSAPSIAQEYNANAQKCHYLMEQIADFIKQLYEYFFLNKNEIKKKQKNISSDLLASISKQLTTEDISIIDMHTAAYN